MNSPAIAEAPAFNSEMRAAALACLMEKDAANKARNVHALARAWQLGKVQLDPSSALVAAANCPGRPDRPVLISPLEVKRRSMRTVEGRAALIHALAHIEFNAVNLALDAVWRFCGMPREYYAEWLGVAAEEATHFELLGAHLGTMGFSYGDFPGHDSLWEMSAKTANDVLARMALVPRTLEARGLDATPAVRGKLAQAGDVAGAAILDIILRDEIGHVAIGNRWYNWLCQQKGLEPIATYAALAMKFRAPILRGPFNIDARRAAGFSELELAELSSHAVRKR
ncbi:MAG: ferritin-like protein [Herminiimonas sp.]|nr:ferritin-like protein [Herminiimonas sp.]